MLRPLTRAIFGGIVSLLCGCDLDPGKVDRIVGARDAAPLLVATTSGPVIGRRSPDGQAFLGIPYAAPPVGPLRWRAPRPVARWSEPRPAVELGETCLQNLSLAAQTGQQGSGPVLGSEDCLTLNVYAPAEAAASDRRPVMVWVHGGALVLGSGGQYDPSLLARNTGAILLTINYRLGTLGFLAHPAMRHEPGEGAFGLMDQQAALRWVQANIARFGGDPLKVTLFGQSAGAWSTCDQLASPAAAGLFGRAILESGACTTPETSLPVAEAEAGGLRLADDLGCGQSADALECLRTTPARELTLALPQRRGVTGPNSWSPATGLDVLPLPPGDAFASGHFNRVPVIAGTNRDEGRLFTYLRGYQGELWTESSYAKAMGDMFGAGAAAILQAYPASQSGGPGLAYATVLTDALFACATRNLEQLLARSTRVYAYEFDDPQAPFGLPRMPWAADPRSFHAAEVAYVMGRPWILADSADFDDEQAALSARIQAYWGNFARIGKPGTTEAPWPSLEIHGGPTLLLAPGRPVGFVEDFAARHRCGFWASLGY